MARFLIITFAFAFCVRVLSAAKATRIYPSTAALSPPFPFSFPWEAFYASNKESEPNNPSNAQLLAQRGILLNGLEYFVGYLEYLYSSGYSSVRTSLNK